MAAPVKRGVIGQILRTIEKAGIIFIAENGGGAGVRLKAKAKRNR